MYIVDSFVNHLIVNHLNHFVCYGFCFALFKSIKVIWIKLTVLMISHIGETISQLLVTYSTHTLYYIIRYIRYIILYYIRYINYYTLYWLNIIQPGYRFHIFFMQCYIKVKKAVTVLIVIQIHIRKLITIYIHN